MASIAVERPEGGVARVDQAVRRGLLLVAVLGLLWGLWEGYLALGMHSSGSYASRRHCRSTRKGQVDGS
jgi:hypothetical protein